MHLTLFLHRLHSGKSVHRSRTSGLDDVADAGILDRMLSPSDTVRRLGGIARGSHLQTLGFDRRALSRAVAAGALQRLRPGVFSVGVVADDVRTATEHGGALTCVSELRRLGVWTLSSSESVHVWLGPGHHARRHDGCQCLSHYHRGRPPLGSVGIATALLHLRQCEGDEAFFAAFESAWQRRLLTRVDRNRVRAGLPISARWMVDLARADAESGLESLLRLRMHLLGIRLDCQVVIVGVGRVDFLLDGRIIIEADGKENHDGTEKRHKDLVRDAAASALGYETLHFDYAQIVHDWDAVQSSVLAALRRSRQRP